MKSLKGNLSVSVRVDGVTYNTNKAERYAVDIIQEHIKEYKQELKMFDISPDSWKMANDYIGSEIMIKIEALEELLK